MIESFGVYFIDRRNFRHLCDRADRGDPLAVDLVQALMQFFDHDPKQICSMCDQHVCDDDLFTMVFVVLRADKATLTTWICESCAMRDQIESFVETLARDWPVIPKDSTFEVSRKRTTTLH